MALRPLKDRVIVKNITYGIKKTKSGIIIPDMEMKESGIKPQWAQIYLVGSNIQDLSPGQWVLLKFGRWSRGIPLKNSSGEEIRVHLIDYPDSILLVSDENNSELEKFVP